MQNKCCFFIGHRDAPDSLLPALTEAVERHIREDGVNEFVVGRYGRFDALAALAVRRAKAAHPDVRLLALCPYLPTQAAEGFDGLLYPPEQEQLPRRLAIILANRYMADHCGYLIAYAWQSGGSATTLAAYAQRRGRCRVTWLENPIETIPAAE